MQIILASQSPRRRELLAKLGLPFTVQAVRADETMDPGLDPRQEVARVSRVKAMAAQAGPEDVVIAADTIVVCQGRILGKPRDKAQAADMLAMLSGRDHQVMTGYTLRRGSQVITGTEVSHIFFRPLDPAEIRAYVETGEPMDKAGAYGIQGLGSLLVEKIDGDFFNVMGLPVCRLNQMLRSLGIDILRMDKL